MINSLIKKQCKRYLDFTLFHKIDLYQAIYAL